MSQAASPEVIITAFIDAIHPSFNYVVVLTTFSSCLLTLLVVLFAFSTKESRRRLVFHLNVLAICLALILGIFSGITSGRAVLDPFHLVSKNVYIATIVFAVFPPLFYDSILLFRLFALYPPATTPKITLLKIFAFPFCIKCARIVVISLVLNNFVQSATSTAALVQNATAAWFRNPYLIAEWSMQIADNLYSVSFFLYKLHIHTSNFKRASSLAERIRQIFYIAVANFVFPLLFNIGQIICITTSRSSAGTMLLLTNNYVTVIGILCATIWFSGTEWVRTRSESSGPNRTEMRFAVDITLKGTDSDPASVMELKQRSALPNDESLCILQPCSENKGHNVV